MGFLVPIFAVFAALAAVPFLLHLHGRPQAVRRRFAAMRFLVESDKKTAAKRRLRELLLLLLRGAAIAAIPLILAKPFLDTRSDIPGGMGESESAVIVLDDSRSMGMREDGLLRNGLRSDTALSRAQARARRLIDSMGHDSEAALLLTSQGAQAPQAELTADRQRLARAVSDVKPGHRTGDTTSALKRAAAILAASPRPLKRVYLVSDLAAHGYTTEPPWAAGGPELVPIDVGSGEAAHPAPNRAVVSVRVEPAAQLGPRGVQVEAVIENFGDEAQKEQALTLRVDGKAVATGLLDLPARGSATKRFFHVFGHAGQAAARENSEEGAPHPSSPNRDTGSKMDLAPVHEMVVELSPDGLTDDDRRYLRFEERPSLRVLLVDGDPRTVRRDDEVFYLETALRPGEHDESRLDVHVTTLDDLGRLRLDDEDVIFLVNCKAPDGGRAAALSAFVSRGGGLFLSVGDNVDPDAWNAALGDLLPQPLASLRTVGQTLRARDDGETSGAATSLGPGDGERIARFDRGHPVLAPFDGPASSLREARVGRYALLKPTPNGDSDAGERGVDGRRVLLRLDGGAPLLVEGKKGNGRVLLLTTTLDRDWSNLAIQPAYLPLMQQSAHYLARAPLTAPAPPSLVGQARDLSLGDGDTRVEVTMPSGATRWFGEDRARGRNALHYTDTDEPGFYRVSVAGGSGGLQNRPASTFAVNVDPSESDLARIDPARLQALSQPIHSDGKSVPRRRVELWHALGAILLGLLFLESMLAVRRR